MATDKPIIPVPNLAPTAVDKILAEREEMEREAPSAPVTYTPDGMQITAKHGDKVEVEAVNLNDLAHTSVIHDPYKTDLSAANKKHVIDKVYMNSEEFNELRRQLYEQHREVFNMIGGYMVHDPFVFVMRMNTWLGTNIQFDSWNEKGICAAFLKALENKRTGAPQWDIDKIAQAARKGH